MPRSDRLPLLSANDQPLAGKAQAAVAERDVVSDWTGALTALLATGLPRWDGVIALLGAGVAPGAFPELAGLPASFLRPGAIPDATVALRAFDGIAAVDPEGAGAALCAWLDGRSLEDLSLGEPWMNRLPDRLEVKGTLCLQGSAIVDLPVTLRLGGELNIRGTAVAALPAGLKVGGDLLMEGSLIRHLPDRLEVGGYVEASGCSIASLGRGIWVGGTLRLTGNPIVALPDDLVVGECLDLCETPIETLPQGLNVGAAILLRGCKAWDGRIPAGAQVRRVISDMMPSGLPLRRWRDLFPQGEP
jgi:hypothetical protein